MSTVSDKLTTLYNSTKGVEGKLEFSKLLANVQNVQTQSELIMKASTQWLITVFEVHLQVKTLATSK